MDGIIVIDKPKGLTSHDIVLRARHKINQQKIGHTGTLDPMATGVLILVLGKSTKLVTKFANQDKKYEVTLRFGIKTDTADITGKVIEHKEIENINNEIIEDILSTFQGKILQTPPMVSAKKYKGKPLYKYARQGKIVERKAKEIHIYSIELNYIKLPELSFKVHCSKGTYIRTLCEDIGQAMGTCACASSIRRTKSGIFSIDQAITLYNFINLSMNQIKEISMKLLLSANQGNVKSFMETTECAEFY